MSKKKLNNPQETDNAQEKIHHATAEGNQNQNHNAKKVSLGPNTKR